MARETINGISVPIPGTGEPADFQGDLRQFATDLSASTDAGIDTRTARRGQLWTGQGRRVHVKGETNFFVKGVNLGPKVDDAAAWWGADWDWDWWTDSMDKARNVGANAIRFLGNFEAYTANPAQYKSRYHATIEYARDLGMKVLPTFMNSALGGANDTVLSSDDAAQRAMIADLMANYIGDPVIFGWDICNELQWTGNVNNQAVITSLAPYIRTIDPTAKVTCSQSINNTAEFGGVLNSSLDALLDFNDIHIYNRASRGNFPPDLFSRMRAGTTKPILIGEIGSNAAAVGVAAGPYPGGARGQAAHLRAYRRYAAGGDLMGFMVWKIKDSPTNVSKFGLYDSAGDPTPQLNEFLAYPSQRLDAARDFVDYRPLATLVDSFNRAASVSAVGEPELGPVPTAGLGSTWGLTGTGAYVATKATTKPDVLYYDLRSLHTAGFEAEFEVANPSTLSCGIVFDVTDADNYYLWHVKHNAGKYEAGVLSWAAGVSTIRVSYFELPELYAAETPHYLRMGMTFHGGQVVLTVGDRQHLAFDKNAAHVAATTRYGVLLGSGDNGTVIRHVQNVSRGRSY